MRLVLVSLVVLAACSKTSPNCERAVRHVMTLSLGPPGTPAPSKDEQAVIDQVARVTLERCTDEGLSDARGLRWANPLGATVCGRLIGVTALANGNVIAVGGFRDQVSLPNGPLVASSGADGIVLEVSPSGDVLGGTRFGGTGDDFAQGVAGTARGSLLVAASLASTPDTGCSGLSTTEEQDFFLGSF